MTSVHLTRDLAGSLLAYARDQYPNEMIVLLRAKRSRERILIHQVIFAPFMRSGRAESMFNPYQVPIDSSIIGTAHSHPSGSTRPSLEDLLHVYGSIMMIVAYPFTDESCIEIYDAKGNTLGWDLVNEEE